MLRCFYQAEKVSPELNNCCHKPCEAFLTVSVNLRVKTFVVIYYLRFNDRFLVVALAYKNQTHASMMKSAVSQFCVCYN
jgi:hypothetical protein